MFDIARDIQSLSHFKRNTAQVMKQMRKSGNPVVLTVNGKAEVIVQDAASYQEIVRRLERAEAVAAIRQGVDEFERGEDRDARKAFDELRRKHEIPG